MVSVLWTSCASHNLLMEPQSRAFTIVARFAEVFQSLISCEYQRSIRDPRIYILCHATVHPFVSSVVYTRGTIREAQIALLSRNLCLRSAFTIFLVCHHMMECRNLEFRCYQSKLFLEGLIPNEFKMGTQSFGVQGCTIGIKTVRATNAKQSRT